MMIITASFMLKKTHQNTLFNYETARKMHSEGDLRDAAVQGANCSGRATQVACAADGKHPAHAL